MNMNLGFAAAGAALVLAGCCSCPTGGTDFGTTKFGEKPRRHRLALLSPE